MKLALHKKGVFCNHPHTTGDNKMASIDKSTRIPNMLKLVLTACPEGGYTVTSPTVPELITEGDSIDEACSNARDALSAIVELEPEVDTEQIQAQIQKVKLSIEMDMPHLK